MKFEVVAVGEIEPDTYSWMIERSQSKQAKRKINYSHLALLIDGTRVFDSTERGIAECTLDELLDHGRAVIRKRIEVPVLSECCALAWLEAMIGKEYPSNWQLLAMRFWWLRWLPWTKDGRSELHCAGFVAAFLHDRTPLPQHYFRKVTWIYPFQVIDRTGWALAGLPAQAPAKAGR
jgi:hypothetical protein